MSDDEFEYDVIGGAGGLEADMDDMDDTGSRIRTYGWDVGETSVGSQRYLVDANLLTSAPLAPGTFATFEKSMFTALNGNDGLTENAIRMTGTGLFMQAKAKGYAATDNALEWVEDFRQHQQGQLVGEALLAVPPPVAAVMALAGGGSLAAWIAAEGGPEKWMVKHPDVLEEIVASAPGLLDSVLPGLGTPSDTADAAGLLSLLYDQDAGPVQMSDPSNGGEEVNNLRDAMLRVAEYGKKHDNFGIERVGEGPDAVYNIYLPGTEPDAFDLPTDQSDTVRSLGTNFAALAGTDNAYEQSVIEAMEKAGIPPGAQVNLFGHSQGGIVAARLAQRLTDSEGGDTQYDVRNVVTAGSPVDAIEVPESVRILSLVNEYDITPRLDGEAYGDRSNHTTVVTRDQRDKIADNHSLSDVYAGLAGHLDEIGKDPEGDPEVGAALDNLNGFQANGQEHTSWTFKMDRAE